MKQWLWIILCCPSAWLVGVDITITVDREGDEAFQSGGYYADMTEGTDLRGALNFVNQQNLPANHYTIAFDLPALSSTITLESPLPVMNQYYTPQITLDGTNGGNPIAIDGGGSYRGLFANQGTIAIQNLTIQRTFANAGSSRYGGTALAAGAGLFINQANVTLTNVAFSSNSTQSE